ncbi:MAG TPA: IPExxxVDY family protein [Bacteroidia bacterium]|nr:IPExxxVDY family protein [Bacteroidia bacterium]
MAKHVLNIKDEDYDFVLLGLSLLKDQYETTVAVNECLSINLSLDSEVSLALKGDKLFSFSLFTCFDEDFGIEYLLVPNTSNFEAPKESQARTDLFGEIEVEERTRLIRELPLTDYFLILKGEEVQKYQHSIVERLKKLEGLMQVQIIDVTDLPSRSNLVF